MNLSRTGFTEGVLHSPEVPVKLESQAWAVVKDEGKLDTQNRSQRAHREHPTGPQGPWAQDEIKEVDRIQMAGMLVEQHGKLC